MPKCQLLLFMIDTNNFWNWKRHNALQSIIQYLLLQLQWIVIITKEDYGHSHLKVSNSTYQLPI